ncbi:MAG TPA: hypothetical protein VGK67_17665 [Myxococcales bacterium]|jgi:hypothetical protein
MDAKALLDHLKRAAKARDFAAASEAVVAELESSKLGMKAMPTILEFMEAHPDLDFGCPGALTHFVETFFRKGYEEQLIASIRRRPTAQTVWMLNRVINGTKAARTRADLLKAMRKAESSTSASAAARAQAAHFLELLDD